MGESFVAQRRIVVGSLPDGSDDVRNPGDAVPEAADWPNLRSYLSSGILRAGSGGALPPRAPVRPLPQPPAPAPVAAQEAAGEAQDGGGGVVAPDPIAGMQAARKASRFGRQ